MELETNDTPNPTIKTISYVHIPYKIRPCTNHTYDDVDKPDAKPPALYGAQDLYNTCPTEDIYVLYHADCMAHTRGHELDHNHLESIPPEIPSK